MEITYSLPEIPEAARGVLQHLSQPCVVLIDGPMGAGKTTLIKALCEQLGVEDTVSSPTFSLVNEYRSPQGAVYHFDFYRINHVSEAVGMGAEDYFYSGQFCFIEWASKIENILPDDYFLLSLEIKGEHTRKLTLRHGEWNV